MLNVFSLEKMLRKDVKSVTVWFDGAFLDFYPVVGEYGIDHYTLNSGDSKVTTRSLARMIVASSKAEFKTKAYSYEFYEILDAIYICVKRGRKTAAFYLNEYKMGNYTVYDDGEAIESKEGLSEEAFKKALKKYKFIL